MLWKRNVKTSVHYMLTNYLTDPPADLVTQGFPVYNVYTEDDYRNVELQPTVPFVFLVDYGIALSRTRLPVIVVEMNSMVGSYGELGNSRRMQVHECTIHVHGRHRGERDDLAAGIASGLFSLDVYDWTDPAHPSLIEQVAIDESIGVADVHVNDASGEEGTMHAWSLISLRFITIHC